MKKIFIVTLLTVLLLLSVFPTAAAAEIPELDSKSFETLWRGLRGYYNTMYDTASLQISPQVTVFLTDSKGVPYADGKAYIYGIYEKQYTASEIMEQSKIRFSQVMTEDLVNSIVEDLHVSGGPDIEQVRVDDEGNLYKLHLVSLGLLDAVHSITIDGNRAQVICDMDFDYTKKEYCGNAQQGFVSLKNTTVDLIYTNDGWRISGGEVFDYVRNFANVYPGAEYDTAPSTGDESDTAVIPLAVGAIISALIPTTVFIRRRKFRFEV